MSSTHSTIAAWRQQSATSLQLATRCPARQSKLPASQIVNLWSQMSTMQRRKDGKKREGAQQGEPNGGTAGATASPKPRKAAEASAGAHGTAAKRAQKQEQPRPRQKEQQEECDGSGREQVEHGATSAGRHLDAFALLAALLALLACHRAAVRVLAPQTGDWLAESFCSLVLFALAAVGAVAGHVADEGSAVLAAVGGAGDVTTTAAPLPVGTAARSWWAAAAAALLLSVPAGGPPASLAGQLLLSPGLADDGSLRITDTELTLRAMALAAVLAGPLFVAVGCAAGAAGGGVLRSAEGPVARLQLLLLLAAVGGTAVAGMGWGLPGVLVPPRPAASLPPAIAAFAFAMAALLSPAGAAATPPTAAAASTADKKQQRRRSTSSAPNRRPAGGVRRRTLAGVLAALAAAVAAHRAVTPCGLGGPQGQYSLEEGRYTVLAQCEAAGGGRLGVIEGVYKEQYRYRLLRMDHSVLGGEYVAPADVAGQSIYTAFYLQQAAVLFRPNGTLSLHVGLGIGTAVKGMQRMGVAADSLELVPEVLQAAQRFFGLRPSLGGGQAVVGDALDWVPRLAGRPERQRYDYVLHDVFSGGGAAAALMDAPFYRQLSRALAPGGVLAVNYYGGKGQGLKEAWCQLRLVFDSVRAFADVEKSRTRNHVLFASNSNLHAANLTAAVLAAGQAQAAAEAAGREVHDPLQLRVWRSLGRQEIQLQYDRQRCLAMLRRAGAVAPRPGRQSGQQDELEEDSHVPGDAAAGAPGAAGARQRQRQAEHARGQARGQVKQQAAAAPWFWRQLQALRERHALATTHWVAMRTQFADSLWLS